MKRAREACPWPRSYSGQRIRSNIIRSRLPLGRIDHFHERHASVKVWTESGTAIAILAFRTLPDAVGQRGLKEIEVASRNVDPLICRKTS